MHACLFLRVSMRGGQDFEAHLATLQGMLGGVLNVAAGRPGFVSFDQGRMLHTYYILSRRS